ncbi:hypothetical protein K501DRAFT_305795 [Backusella circina FSU 941]|nr:hypothetical protein K501DRAFT_305795 [Backusella circina FSU 941]
MFHTLPSSQESTMNLLTSPYDPNQLQYVLESELQCPSQPQTQPVDVPNNRHSNNFMFNTMSLPNSVSPLDSFRDRTCSPELDAIISNDFISRSPESSSSTESNIVSPPQQFYPSNDYGDLWNDAITIPPSIGSGLHRSASVPIHFNDMKKNTQSHLSQSPDPYLYNQFNIAPQSNKMNAIPLPPKPLPIQIKRVTSTSQSNRPVDVESYRQQLDEKLIKINFDDITVAELKEMLRERGLSATGRKAELMAKLREERELLMAQRCANASASPALHRRVANMSLADESPKRHSRHFYPYSPQTSKRYASLNQMGSTRLASSMPDTPSYLNDQFINKQRRNSSCLRNPVHTTTVKQEEKSSWSGTPRQYSAPPVNKLEEINEAPEQQDIWDEQMLQNFLRQI